MESEQFNWNADDYANNSSAQLQWADELIAKLDLKGCESILDIGCGDGKITAQLAQIVRNGYVLGIDSSESMIQRASKQFPSGIIPNLSFRHMDAIAIRLSEKFDVAFSNAALHWVKDQPAMLRHVHACLKTGGKVLFQMGGRGNAAGIFDVMQRITGHPRWQQYYENFKPPYHFYGPDEYKVWLMENGFTSSRIELLPKDMQNAGVEGLKGWLRTTWFPYTERLPIGLREAFLEEVVGIYLISHPVDGLGNTHVDMVRLEVEGNAL